MREEALKMFEQLSEEDKEKIIALASALLQDQTEFHKTCLSLRCEHVIHLRKTSVPLLGAGAFSVSGAFSALFIVYFSNSVLLKIAALCELTTL